MRFGGRILQASDTFSDVAMTRGRWAFSAPAIVALIGVAIALIVTFGPATLENTSSAGRTGEVGVPGSHTFQLSAKKYALWYGLENAPLDYQIHLPPLSFDIRPPAGDAEPAFTESHGAEDNTHGLAIRRVAYLRPSAAGRYVISVSGKYGPGGVILVGEALPNESPKLLPGAIVLAGALLVAGLIALLIRRRITRPKS